MRLLKRITSFFLAMVMVLAMLPTTVFAANDSDKSIVIEAAGGENNTITVGSQESNVPGGEAQGDTLSLYAEVDQPIARDYDQTINVQVKNITDQPVKYYLECENDNSDIYMNFVKSGSVDAPLTIQANETQAVELSVFAQNASKTHYQIRILGKVTDGETVEMPLAFSCVEVDGSVEFAQEAVDENTLTTVYTVTNSGSTDISDLTLAVAGEAVDYVRINPSMENYTLGAGQSVQVKLIPDLFKMKENSKTVITGTLNAEGGGTGSTEISFDTEGKEITATTIGELALLQDDNPYYDIKFDEDTFSFVTNNGTEEQNLADITAKYWDENDPEKDGVNTAEEFIEVIRTLFDEDGMIDFTISDTLVYNEGKERIPVSVRVSSELVETEGRMRSSVQETGITYDSSTNQMSTTYKIYMTLEEYREYVEEMDDAGKWLKISNLPENILGEPDSIHGQVAVTVQSSITSSSLSFLQEYVTDPYQFVDFNQIDDVQTFANQYDVVSDLAEATKPLKTLNTVSNVIGTGVDVYDTVSLWTNPSPNISTSDKVEYTSLQIAKNINTYVGGTLFGKGGAALGGAVADGPGAIVGFFAGRFISDLIGRGLDQWIEGMEANMYGGAIYYDIYGRQCTNAGRVTSNFYLPDIDTSAVGLYETGRMYDGSPYGGNASYADEQFGGDIYIHDRPVNYEYILNDKTVGNTKNNGLTSVSIVDLTEGAEYLKPGNNTIIRNYDTNAGHYSVVADTEITVLYPSDTPISYIGSPDAMEEVRLRPDFAVYWENILPAHTAIIGEENTVSVNLYNRGSMGGWTDVTVTDGTSTVYEGHNLYVGAFSEKNISFNWTPSGENTELTVTLKNKCVGVEERKSDNNTAIRTIIARERQVPSFTGISPDEAPQDDKLYITADLTNTKDLVSVNFTVDSTSYSGNAVTLVETSAGARATVEVSNLTPGVHTVTAEATYRTGSETTGTLSSSQHSLTIKPLENADFSVDKTVVDPTFIVLYEDSSWLYKIETVVSKATDGDTYYFAKTADMMEHPENYFLLTVCTGGVILTPVSDLSASTALTLTGGKSISFAFDAQTVQMQNVYLDRLDENTLYTQPRVELAPENKMVIKGADTVELQVNFTVDEMGSSANVIKTLGGAPIIVDLSDYYKLYQFSCPSLSAYINYIDIQLYVESAQGTATIYGSTMYDEASGQISLLVDGAYYLERLKKATSITAYLPVDDTLYVADLLSYSGPVVLDRTGYGQIVYTCSAGTPNIGEIMLKVEDTYNPFYLYETPLYLPAGTYTIAVSYELDGKHLFHIETVTITNEQTASVALPGNDLSGTAPLTINWPEWLADQGNVSYEVEAEGEVWYPYLVAERGQSMNLPAGTFDLNVYLYKDSSTSQDFAYSLEVMREVTLEEGQASSMEIGSSFQGAVQTNSVTRFPGDSIWLDIGNPVDSYGNVLTSYWTSNSNQALAGTVTLTSTEDPSQCYEIEVNTTSFNRGLRFDLPNHILPGTYTVAVLLSNGIYVEQPANRHSIVASAEPGGSISPSGQVLVPEAGSQTFTIRPDNGYAIQEVFVDGASQGPITSYTFTDVREDHAITARFREKVVTDTGSSGSSNSGDYTTSVDTTSGGKVTVSPSRANKDDIVTITVKPYDGYVLDELVVTDRRGDSVEVTRKDDDEYTFIMPDSKVSVKAIFVEAGEENLPVALPFTDINMGDYFYDAVSWAVENGITTGTSVDTFSPHISCTRGQMMTFLWRSVGSPIPSGTQNPFVDLSPDAYYYQAVLWAVENDITNGTSDITFSPNEEVTRAQTVTFLWRVAGSPEASGRVFDDIAADDWYRDAVVWAVQEGITSGISATEFGPNDNCTRAQIVTFLYRNQAGK